MIEIILILLIIILFWKIYTTPTDSSIQPTTISTSSEPEVFQISADKNNHDIKSSDIDKICSQFNSTIATTDQLKTAYTKGYQLCETGFSHDVNNNIQTNIIIQDRYNDGCTGETTTNYSTCGPNSTSCYGGTSCEDHSYLCGLPGINTISLDIYNGWTPLNLHNTANSVFCYGPKPIINNATKTNNDTTIINPNTNIPIQTFYVNPAYTSTNKISPTSPLWTL